ncbi:MAG: VTT domain-containing protein [Oligoflexus sp.]
MRNDAEACKAILQEGRNIWKAAHADRLAFLIDGENYFRELYQALLQAKEQVFVVGWDIHSNMLLCPGSDQKSGGQPLLEIINAIAKQNPELAIHILSWDYSSFIYSIEREALQSLKFGWMAEKNVHFHFDDDCPLGGSHHQKLVVIDDQLAFCGGLDLTVNRWDRLYHQADDPLRLLPNGKPYAPFHDVQLGITGEPARLLGDLVRERWQSATGNPAAQPKVDYEFKFSDQLLPRFVLESVPVGISRTRPGFHMGEEVREVEFLYLDMIKAAQKFIYLENQYLTSSRIVTALAQVLQKGEQAPEVIIVLPKRAGGWLEANTMGLMQNAALFELKRADERGKLKIVYPEDKKLRGDAYITVHSKLMIVDGLMARVGSANLNHRSMGLDTECDIVVDASQDEHVRQGVMAFLASLLADHLGLKFERVDQELENASLLAAIETLNRQHQHKSFEDVQVDESRAELGRSIAEAELLDMERPSKFEQNLDHWAFISEKVGKKEPFLRRNFGMVVTALLAIGIALLIALTPLKDWLNPGELEERARFLGGPLEISLVGFVAFVLSGFIFIPLNLLIIVSASILPAWNAFILIFIGTIGSATSGYLLGRLMKDRVFERFLGKRSKKVLLRIQKGGLPSILFVRVVPVAPHALINLTAGFSRIKFWHFILGTAIGSLPGSITLVLFQRSLIEVVSDFSMTSLLILIGIVVVIAGIIYLLRTRFSKYVEGGA